MTNVRKANGLIGLFAVGAFALSSLFASSAMAQQQEAKKECTGQKECCKKDGADKQCCQKTGEASACCAGKTTVEAVALSGEPVKVGEAAPDFKATDQNGKEWTLSDFINDNKIVVLEWFNPECPFVKKHYENGASTMNTLAKDFKDKDVVWLTVNSGSEDSGTNGAELMKTVAKDWKIERPIIIDAAGAIGKAYGAKHTPTMVIIGKDGNVVYRGAIDDNPGRDPGKVNYVRNALNQLIAGETVTVTETKAYGCGVKYKN